MRLPSFLRHADPDPPKCECPIRVREIDKPLAHLKTCPVRVAYDHLVEEQVRAESERVWA